MTIEMGMKARDIISGFEGIVTGRCQYITGCDQCLVTPQGLDEKGNKRDGIWFDLQRLELVDESRITLDNARTPGPDMPAPIK